MHKLITQRFVELEQKANEILAAKTESYSHLSTRRNFEVNRPAVTAWATSVLNLLQRVFSKNSVPFKEFREWYNEFNGGEFTFLQCVAVLKSAKEDYEGGYLFDIRSLIQAEVFDDSLEQATELLKSGYKDPACVVTGVTLETTLKQLCSRNGIPLGKLDKMNADLCKAGVYNMGMQKQITAWADRRNSAAHGDWNEYSADDVKDFISGVRRLIAEKLSPSIPT